MLRKGIYLLSAILIATSFIPSLRAYAADPAISIKLVNYLGNTNSVPVTVNGTYSLSHRLGGANRFEVAAKVAEKGWNEASTVFIANYLAFADALSATPYAYKLNAPILLTQADTLTQATKDEIKKLNPTNIVIVGGPVSVSNKVIDELKSLGIAGGNITRIGGEDRFAVARNIAQNMGNYGKAIVTNGLKFPDSLTIAPYAARNGYPILLTLASKVPQPTMEALQGHGTPMVVGGPNSVSESVFNKINADLRIGGADRFEVAANIIRKLNLNTDQAFLATGLKFADALTGSVLAAKLNSPILLTLPDDLTNPTTSVINDKNINMFTVLGGPNSVSTSVMSKLPSVRLSDGNTYYVKLQSGNLVLYNGGQVIKRLNDDFILYPDTYGSGDTISIGSHNYIGKMAFTIDGSNVRPINKDIPFEDYLKGVVPREMPAYWGNNGGLEALKAQAVAARTYAYDDIGEVVADGQTYQVYGGFDWSSTSTQAVEGTKGKVLIFEDAQGNRNLISAVYSSSNGGWTESNSNAWGSAQVPYLPAQKDPEDPAKEWDVNLYKTQINTSASDFEIKNPGHWWWKPVGDEKNPGVSKLLVSKLPDYPNEKTSLAQSKKVLKIDSLSNRTKFSTGVRSKSVDVTFEYVVYPIDNTKDTTIYKTSTGSVIFTETVTVDVSRLRTAFGGMDFQSTYLTGINNNAVDKEGEKVINIVGKGFGHGVGMSQWGAYERSQDGQSYQQILGFYYPGSKLVDKY